MSSSEIFLAVLAGLAVLLYGRQLAMKRSIKHYDAPGLAEALKRSSAMVLVDVRTKAERSENHIPGSIHLPLSSLRIKAEDLERYKSKELVFYCATGSRSLRAAALMKKLGFSVANLRGGIGEWNFHNRR
jgi:rhodanese-related sulfurtransferase